MPKQVLSAPIVMILVDNIMYVQTINEKSEPSLCSSDIVSTEKWLNLHSCFYYAERV